MAKPRPTPAILLATGLGVGLYAKAPGTFGALWGLPIYATILIIPGMIWQGLAIALLVLIGVPLADRAARDLVRLDFGVDPKDPQPIVCDEYLTVPIVYACAPEAWGDPRWIALGFALHRIFDITKPWPCRQLEQLPGGLGIAADDVAAAIYAGICYALAWNWFGA